MSETVPCNYCGVDDPTVVFRAGEAQLAQVVRCNRCGLMYASPRAKEPDHVELISARTKPPFRESDSRYQKEMLQVRDYRRTHALLDQLYPRRGRLLEVGSSLGFLLDDFRRDGWDVLGVDPNSEACRIARERLGLPVVNAILEQAGVDDASCDVVLLNHVIEHLDDPLRTLREVNRVLKPGGHFVIETPRYDTLMFKLLGRRERSISCDGHIFFFTNRTLRNLYEAAGFETVRLDCVGRSLTVDRLVWNLGVVSKSERAARALGKLSEGLKLDQRHLYVNLRDMQRVCVRKVAPVQARPRAADAAGAIA
jgi:SAM-dependent methyltransferase